MKDEAKNKHQEEKEKKEFLIFDRGLTELKVNKYKEKEIKQKINWFTLYKILFKNILNSPEVIPLDELILRFNIIRSSLPRYYKGYKGNESNSSAIIKKFTYHICKNRKKRKSPKKRESSEDNNNIKFQNKFISNGNISFKKRNEKKTKTVKVTNKLNLDFLNKNKTNINNILLKGKKYSNLEVLVEKEDFSVGGEKKSSKNLDNEENLNKKIENEFPNIQLKDHHTKHLTISNKNNNKPFNSILSPAKKEPKIKVKFSNNITLTNSSKVKLNNINNNTENSAEDDDRNQIILGTPNDNEFPLVLSQKRSYNTKPSFFFESLNKIKELTKQEKIKTFQKEFTSQILKFNDLYFDPKIDDFYNDKLFNDVKATCDLFINRFDIDSEEEKNLADLDNYL